MKVFPYLIMSFLILFLLSGGNATAKHKSDHPLSDEEWKMILDNVELLDAYNYMPTLLPIIIRNSDTLQLNSEQIKAFRTWRKNNFTQMVNVMNEIIENRISFKRISLDRKTPNNELVERQIKILTLQQELLSIKLSCRKQIIDTFSDDQWDNLSFVLLDHPKLAGFVQ